VGGGQTKPNGKERYIATTQALSKLCPFHDRALFNRGGESDKSNGRGEGRQKMVPAHESGGHNAICSVAGSRALLSGSRASTSSTPGEGRTHSWCYLNGLGHYSGARRAAGGSKRSPAWKGGGAEATVWTIGVIHKAPSRGTQNTTHRRGAVGVIPQC
jgi:hypothetical protein